MATFREYLREASEVKLKDLPKEKLAFLKKHHLDYPKADVFDGIHGSYVYLQKKPYNLNAKQMDREQLKKLINDKNFRWLEVQTVGF